MKNLGRICPPRLDRGSHGIALIAVLWLVALLTLLSSALATLSISHRRAAERYIQTVRAETLADSAIRLTLLRLFTTGRRTTQSLLGEPQTIELPGGSAQVLVEREAGRLDLNTADSELLFAVFAANGWREEGARAMVARIVDWKDVDDVPQEGGAEQSAYAAMGLAYGPRNGPFESVDELRQVLGGERIDASLFDAFTVYTHSRVPASSHSPAPLSRALRFADERQLGGHRWLNSADTQATAAGDDTSLSGELIRVQACVFSQDMRVCRQAVVRLTGSIQRPVQIFSWHTRVAPSI